MTSNNRDRDEDENDLIEVQTLLSACSKVLGPLFVILLRKIMEYFEKNPNALKNTWPAVELLLLRLLNTDARFATPWIYTFYR